METNRAVLTYVTDIPEDCFKSAKMMGNDRVFWNDVLNTTWMFFTMPYLHIRVLGPYGEIEQIEIDGVR